LDKAGNKAIDEYANNEAIGFFDKLIKRLEGTKDKIELKIDSLVKYADIMQFTCQYKLAEENFFIAEKLAIEHDHKKQLAHIYTRLGWNYNLLGDKDSFEVYTYKAISLWKDIGDEIGLAKAFTNLAIAKTLSFEEKIAIDYLKEQLNVFKRNNYKKETLIALLNIGFAEFRIGDMDEAMKMYKEALELAQQISNRKSKAILFGNIASVYMMKKEYDSAIEQYKLALKEFQDIGFKASIPRTYYTIAFCYFEKQEFNEAEKFAVKCNDLVEEINQRDMATEAIIMLSRIRFSITEDPKIIHQLRIMLKATKDNYELAYLNIEIWKMAKKIAYTVINPEIHRQKALELFRELYKKSPLWVFKENIEKLENNN
jgi:tetratricopeptide (TPR) repeat protein